MTINLQNIFRNSFWRIEPIVKKAILYSLATVFIYTLYIFIISFLNNFLFAETKALHFVVMVISMALFLFLRDKFQLLIDRLFYRENYKVSEVITGFEEYLAGVYETEELKSRITVFLNGIFHFKSFIFLVQNQSQKYRAEITYGLEIVSAEFKFSEPAEKIIMKSRVFSIGEIKNIPYLDRLFQWELAITVNSNSQQRGLMILGRKRSERRYTDQEVQLLIMLANRISALFHTAELYRKELERKLALERERTRIAKEFHDDVGASLTRISILAQMIESHNTDSDKARQWLKIIKDSCRDASLGITSIIWALNDKNITTDSMAAHIRRFALEFLEETEIQTDFNMPENLPLLEIKADIRRNIYLCLRESLNNMKKYSSATRVEISLEIANGIFNLSIRDNGKGFDLMDVDKDRNGLANMRKRMQDVGGKFNLETRKGNGTSLSFEIPLGMN
jgi:signal transduction histidine kinase